MPYSEFIDPSFSKWKVEQKSASHYDICTPNQGLVIINDNKLDFWEGFASQIHSTRMWLHSLSFLLHIDNVETIDSIVSTFIETVNEKDAYTILSADHCAAVRLRTICVLFNKYKGDDNENIKNIRTSLHNIAKKDLKWALTDGTLKYNNHGLMLAIAALHYFRVCEAPDEILEKKIFDFLFTLFDSVFDEYYLCNENTIGYHEFYFKTLRELSRFLSVFYKDDILHINRIMSYRDNSLLALNKVVYNCGGIPPIGDSGLYNTKYESVIGDHIFPESGLFVHKNKDFYFSLICGCRSETHKHMDDTSITVRYKDIDLIVDSGVYNYDWTDKFRRCVQSQIGHSGVFFKKYDNLLRGEFTRKHNINAKMHKLNPCSTDFNISCEYTIDDVNWVMRRVNKISNMRVDVVDSFSSKNQDDVVIRYIIPEYYDVSVHGAVVTIQHKSKNLSMRLEFSEVVEISCVKGEKAESYKGWLSKGFNHIECSWCIEISPFIKEGVIITKLFISDSNHQ
ncbi:heparinase II/III family protein [Aeromonas veronii]